MDVRSARRSTESRLNNVSFNASLEIIDNVLIPFLDEEDYLIYLKSQGKG